MSEDLANGRRIPRRFDRQNKSNLYNDLHLISGDSTKQPKALDRPIWALSNINTPFYLIKQTSETPGEEPDKKC
ncbi:hypothetical protein [Burkholderia pseudomallei]|uniref:hypothetical protein n=1 Tax=Burkholderia pseudomallei TaxID=28450 RepID=UPI0016050515|nr:hypothetical protein [Burkholderia pseudomallei]